MKKSVVFILCYFCTIVLFCQTQNFQYSEPFKEHEGWSKLIQLRNGNTALIEITKRKGIFYSLYGADRKLISAKKLPLTKVGEKLGGPSHVPGIYDIGGNTAMFIMFFADGEKGLVPTLFRVIVDGKTGELIDESSLLALKEVNAEDNNEMAFGERDVPTAYVEKDPESDNYAVIGHNPFASDINKVISVIHFGGDHKIISNSHISIPKGNYKYANYLSTYVHKDAYVIIGSYAYNAGKGANKEIKYFLSKVEKGNPVVTQQELKYQNYSRDAKGHFIFNKAKNNLTLLITALNKLDGEEMGYDISFQTINPVTLSVDNLYKDDLTKVNDYYKIKMGSKKDLFGYVGGTSVAPDGSLMVLYQNISKRLINPTVGESRDVHNNYDYTNIIVPISKWSVQTSNLGDLGLSVFSPDGKITDSKALNFAMSRSGNLNEFGYNDVKKGRKPKFEIQDPGLGAAWYFGLDLVGTNTANYIFCNATKENFEKPETERHDRTKAISTTNAVKYTYKNGTISKDYLFGLSTDKKENKFCNFTASDYDGITKTYCTIMVNTKDNKACVTWFKLD